MSEELNAPTPATDEPQGSGKQIEAKQWRASLDLTPPIVDVAAQDKIMHVIAAIMGSCDHSVMNIPGSAVSSDPQINALFRMLRSKLPPNMNAMIDAGAAIVLELIIERPASGQNACRLELHTMYPCHAEQDESGKWKVYQLAKNPEPSEKTLPDIDQQPILVMP